MLSFDRRLLVALLLLPAGSACGSDPKASDATATPGSSGDSSSSPTEPGASPAPGGTSSTSAPPSPAPGVAKGAPGEHDATFATNGVLEVGYYAGDFQLPPFVVWADSSLSIWSLDAAKRPGIGRLTAQGTLDLAAFAAPSAGWGGQVSPVLLTRADAFLYSVTSVSGTSRATRSTNGAFDAAFGAAGFAAIAPPPKPFPGGSWGTPADVVVREGRLHVLFPFVSNTPDRYAFGLVRLGANGAPDATFGTAGAVVVESTELSQAQRLRVDANGRIYAGVIGDAAQPRVYRISASGALDTSFGTGGVASGLGTGGVSGLELDAAGRVYVSSTSGVQAAVTRLDGTGARDASFGQAGTASADFSPGSAGAGVVLEPGGKVVLVARANGADADLGLVRFDAQGKLDPTFGQGGRVRVTRPGEQKPIWGGAAYDPAGRLVVVSVGEAANAAQTKRLVERFWL